MRTNKMMSMMIVVAVAFVFMGGCALREKDMESSEGEGEGEGVEGEGEGSEGEGEGNEGEGEGDECSDGQIQLCNCANGDPGVQVCKDGCWGECQCECEGGCEGEGEGEGNECQVGQRQCVNNAWQDCSDNGYWNPLTDCSSNQTCVNGECVGQLETRECNVWIESNMLCGDIVDLAKWTFGCMPADVERVCALQTPTVSMSAEDKTCTTIPNGVNAAWPMGESENDWLTVKGCEARDGLLVTEDPNGGHFLTLP